MELSLLGKLEIWQFIFPTNKRKLIFCQEEVKDSLGFREENISNNISQSELKSTIRRSLNGRSNRPDNAVGGNKIDLLDVLFVALGDFALFHVSFHKDHETMGHLDLDGWDRLHPMVFHGDQLL